jgi:electron transport complex protein RnfD
MKFTVQGAPHLPTAPKVNVVMTKVVIALMPAIAAHVWVFGPGLLIQIGLACFFGLCFEAVLLQWRGRRLKPFISDGSVVVTAVLLALCLPPLTPWWITATGMLFAVIVAKHLFGGLGYNMFNPAMVGVAVIVIAFPEEFSHWLAPRALSGSVMTFPETLAAIFKGNAATDLGFDALTAPTVLDLMRTGLQAQQLVPEITDQAVFGALSGQGWDVINLAVLLGGLWLLWQRVITWHVPVAVIAATIVLTLPFWIVSPDLHPSPLFQLFSGGLMLGAFFIATDPVSGSATFRGKIVFGIGVAALTLAIRRWGSFPDGVAFAVLLMNIAAPTLDNHTRGRVYGR